MGGYELEGNILNYTGDGWKTFKLTKEQIKQYKDKTLNVLSLKWE